MEDQEKWLDDMEAIGIIAERAFPDLLTELRRKREGYTEE